LVALGCRKQVTAKSKKYAAVSGAKKDFLTLQKSHGQPLARRIRDFVARYDAIRSLQTTRLAFRFVNSTGFALRLR